MIDHDGPTAGIRFHAHSRFGTGPSCTGPRLGVRDGNLICVNCSAVAALLRKRSPKNPLITDPYAGLSGYKGELLRVAALAKLREEQIELSPNEHDRLVADYSEAIKRHPEFLKTVFGGIMQFHIHGLLGSMFSFPLVFLLGFSFLMFVYSYFMYLKYHFINVFHREFAKI